MNSRLILTRFRAP